MNTKRLIIAIVAGFLFYFGSDFLVHGVWMVSDYKATASLWRPDSEMTARMPWMMLAHLLYVVAFVILWAQGFAARACPKCAVLFGLFMGLFLQSNTLISYVVSPLPPVIAIKWFVAGLLQAVLLGIITFFTYKPAPAAVAQLQPAVA